MAMAMRGIDRVIIAVHDAVAPTDDEWSRWIALGVERKGSAVRAVVETQGGGPSAKQRKELADALSGFDLRSAILTSSLVTRGIVTAISWLNLSLRAFAPDQHAAAADYLGLSRDELAEVLATLPTLRAACGIGRSERSGAG